MILNQWQTWECKDYWFATALFIMNPSIDKQAVLSAINESQSGMLTNRKAWEFFKARWFIKEYESVPRLKWKWILNRGIPLICNVNNVDWEKTKVSPFIAQFVEWKWNSHNCTIVSYDPKTRLLKVANTWWEEFWDNGYYYLRAQDLKNTTEFCRLII